MGIISKSFALSMVLIIAISSLSVLMVKPTNAQMVRTLGPVQIRSSGDSGTNIRIIMPQNKTSVNNPVEVLFCVNVALLPYSSPPFADIGYSIDNSEVYNVNDLINQTIIHGVNADEATVWAKVTLSNISKGNYNLIIYVGSQFEGVPENPQLQRYEVWAFSTVNFSVTSKTTTPAPTVPEMSLLVIVPLLLTLFFVAVILRHRTSISQNQPFV
jgi:hypothetical protein